MSDPLSEEHIREHCPFCDRGHVSQKYLLEETEDFLVVCDYNPLVEGHLLIIPKQHIASIGQYPPDLFEKFVPLYMRVSDFVRSNYGSVSTFEHGGMGQSVFHSHVHVLPFSGSPMDIVPEGRERLTSLASIEALQGQNQYLFFSIQGRMWTVDPALVAPRFFRTRFAAALGKPERADWKSVQNDPTMRAVLDPENEHCQSIWHILDE